MAAISYIISAGQTLEQVTAGTAAPTSGSLEIRMDQTAGAVTDASVAGGVRIVKKAELLQMIETLKQQLIRDTAVVE